jgi:transposase-like protein
MSKQRNHDPALKARVVLEALKGERTVSEGVSGNGQTFPDNADRHSLT